MSPATARRAASNGRIAFAGTTGAVTIGGQTGDYNSDIFTILPNGLGLQQMTSGTQYDGHADWSPDGTALAYWRGTGTSPRIPTSEGFGFFGPTDIWVVKEGGPENLTNTPDVFEFAPDWSPDAKQIVYERASVGEIPGYAYGDYQLFIMDADGSNAHHLVEGIDASWSPDGAWIAFDGWPTGGISLVTPDGTRRRTLSLPGLDEGAVGRYPDWSADGKRIAFTLDRDVWVINTDGSGHLENLTAGGPSGNSFGPAWSPDGKKIVFIGDGGGGGYRLFTMNADGTNIRALVDIELGSSNVTPPSWTSK